MSPSRRRGLGLPAQIGLFGVLPVLVVLAVQAAIRHRHMDGELRANGEALLRAEVEEAALEIDRANALAVDAARTMALAQESGMFGDRARSLAFARAVLDAYPEFTGTYFGYEPNADGRDAESAASASFPAGALGAAGRFIPYWVREADDAMKVRLEPLTDMETGYYYRGVKNRSEGRPEDEGVVLAGGVSRLQGRGSGDDLARARAMVAEPYLVDGKYIVEQTMPIVVDGRFVGVAGVDRALDDIDGFLKKLRRHRTAEFVLVSLRGRVINATMDPALRTRPIETTPFADVLRGPFARAAGSGLELADDPVRSGRSYFASAKVPTGGWTLLMSVAEEEILAATRLAVRESLAVGVLGPLLVLAILIAVGRRISRPLTQLTSAAERFREHSFDPNDLAEVEARTDEIGDLARTFTDMAAQVAARAEVLDQLVRERTRELGEKNERLERVLRQIEEDLAMAKRLQHWILPGGSLERRGASVYARMLAAREVGGDFYDFFEVDRDRLGFVIADVSGKGVAAALMMAVACTTLRSIVAERERPGEVLSALNDELSADNDASMFVTLVYGIIDVATGELVYSNAGHPQPYLLRSGGGIEPLPGHGGMALGVVAGERYQERAVRLAPGDTIFCYSDGITDANDAAGATFGEARLEEILAATRATSVESLATAVIARVERFAAGTPQADDITCIAVQYHHSVPDAPPPSDTLTIDALSVIVVNELAEIARLAGLVDAFCRRNSLAAETASDLNLVLEELVSNIIRYGWDDGGKHDLQVRIECRGPALRIELEDDGKAFNPLEVSTPDLDSSLEDRPIGGLGIHLVKSLTDTVEYRRAGGRNHLMLTKTVKRDAHQPAT